MKKVSAKNILFHSAANVFNHKQVLFQRRQIFDGEYFRFDFGAVVSLLLKFSHVPFVVF